MKYLSVPFAIVLHIWFFFLMFFTIILLLPFLVVTVFSHKTYSSFYWIARNLYANIILYGMGIWVRVEKKYPIHKLDNYIMVSNHSSLLDFLQVYKVSRKPIKFIGKKSLAKYPLFGIFYKRVSILVDRKKSKSRMEAFKSADDCLKRGTRICIFPEGGIPKENIVLDQFKDGAFRLAIKNKVPIVPVIFVDNKRRFPYSFQKGSIGRCRVIVEKPIDTSGIGIENKNKLRNQVYTLIYDRLTEKK